jgi:Metallo-beta-lactamase superfamily
MVTTAHLPDGNAGTVAKARTAARGRASDSREIPLNDQGYHVGRVERNLFWVTDGVYQSAFLATPDGVVVFDAPPSIGANLRRAVDEVTAAEGVSNRVTHLVYSHHHADHGGAAALFDGDVTRIGHEETKRLLVRDNDPGRPVPEATFADRYTLEVGGERVELAWAGVKAHLDTVTERTAAPVIEKYTGVLAAADIEVFTMTTAFQIMQSLRLDSDVGVSRPARP